MGFLPKFRRNRWQWLFALSLSVMLFIIALPLGAFASSSPQQDMQRLNSYVDQALTKAKAKDFQGAATAYKQFDNDWFDVEDGVKKTSRQAYKDIETAMGEVKFAFSKQPPKQSEVVQALSKLEATNQKFLAGSTPPAETTGSGTSKVTIKSLIDRLNNAEAAIDKNDLSTAKSEIKSFQTDWLDVEGIVATKSKQAYVAIENNMAKAYGFLNASPADIKNALMTIASLKSNLQPYATQSLRYSLFDAVVIILREGIEALLVLVALLAFLTKSGNAHQGRWLWLGAAVGVLASILTAVAINLIFSNISQGGANRELLEGITGDRKS
ncbi:FTR1 family protein, partial [Aetokthonos hydrillicola]|uniref:FTR1 family protein n=1 Tax=Aetokthonos hydrillicola TaxID=1550245 RepID=UPI001ABA1056